MVIINRWNKYNNDTSTCTQQTNPVNLEMNKIDVFKCKQRVVLINKINS